MEMNNHGKKIANLFFSVIILLFLLFSLLHVYAAKLSGKSNIVRINFIKGNSSINVYGENEKRTKTGRKPAGKAIEQVGKIGDGTEGSE